MIDSKDSVGRYCGMLENGGSAETDLGKVGYCGPSCAHCEDHRIYVLQDGVWVCAADYDYPEID